MMTSIHLKASSHTKEISYWPQYHNVTAFLLEKSPIMPLTNAVLLAHRNHSHSVSLARTSRSSHLSRHDNHQDEDASFNLK